MAPINLKGCLFYCEHSMEQCCLCPTNGATVVCSICQISRICMSEECNVSHFAFHLQEACVSGNQRALLKVAALSNTLWEKVEERVETVYIAAEFGFAGLITVLMVIGAKMYRCNDQGFTGMHVAAQLGKVECIRVLAANGMNPNITSGNRSKRTPMIIACTNGMMPSLVALLDLGANPNATNGLNQSPAHISCMYGYSKLLLLLIRKGADLSDASEQNVMVISLVFGHYDCVGILLAHHVPLPTSMLLPYILPEQMVC